MIIPAIAAMDEESSKLHDAVSHPLNRLVTQISKIPHGAEQETIFSSKYVNSSFRFQPDTKIGDL